jgi:small GTP-binding protein
MLIKWFTPLRIPMTTKIVVVGATHSGKTALISRYISDEFNPMTRPTTNGACHRKTHYSGGCEFRVEVWDTAGQEQYHALGPLFYRNAQAGIIVFDVTERSTFAQCSQWASELRQALGDACVILLAGNKVDLYHTRAISEVEVVSLADSIRVNSFETSAKTGQNVNALFDAAVRLAKERSRTVSDQTQIKGAKKSTSSVKFDDLPVPAASGCCQ